MAASPLASHSDHVAERNRVESMVAALDLQPVGDDLNRWVVHVLGAHIDGGDLWIQIAPRPDGTQSVVLKLSSWATPRHVLAALAALPPGERDHRTIVRVMSSV